MKHYGDPGLGERCYFFVLKFYLSKLAPKVLDDPNAVFYWKAKEKTPLDSDAPWFMMQPVGRNVLATMMKKMCESVGIQGKTNHSLRATGATRLFEGNVPEKLIQERTGYRSSEALWSMNIHHWLNRSQYLS